MDPDADAILSNRVKVVMFVYTWDGYPVHFCGPTSHAYYPINAQPDDHERMIEATGKQMAVGSHVSQEELQRALQQLFDMPSFPIIHLYPNDG